MNKYTIEDFLILVGTISAFVGMVAIVIWMDS